MLKDDENGASGFSLVDYGGGKGGEADGEVEQGKGRERVEIEQIERASKKASRNASKKAVSDDGTGIRTTRTGQMASDSKRGPVDEEHVANNGEGE